MRILYRSVLLSTLLVPGLVRAQPAQDGPRARWSFDAFKGKIATDSSGHANDLMVVNGMLVKGVRGAALAFSETDGNVFMPNPAGLKIKNALTLEAWFNPGVQQQREFAAIMRSDGFFALRFNGGRLGFLLWDGASVVSLHTQRQQWEPGTWYHVAATFDGVRMRLFIDGEEDPNSPHKEPAMRLRAGGAIGVGSLHQQYRFNGCIDEIRIFARSLSETEIQASHERGRASLRAEKDASFTPRRIGKRKKAFRKPLRPIGTVKEGYVWIDAEDFDDYGGWTFDTQFVHLMGSGYLLATGEGTPVKDATTTFALPASGTYRIWVRARNWIREYSPGTFQLLVNGTPMKEIFGDADSAAWTWENGAEVHLEKGRVHLAIHDLTGYYGRCDAIILTTDMDYTPPAQRDQVCAERARLTGLSLAPRDGGEFDVIVVGGGPTGCPAAIACARMGARTALIQNRPVLGGNASDECGVPLNGAASHHRDARETGIVEEVARYRAHYGFRLYSGPFQMLCDAEPNLEVFLNRHVYDVEMADKKTIKSVKAVDTLTGAITIYRAKHFIDTTGDGWVGYFAGAEYRLGREARSEFNESLAPEKADKLTMSGCLMGGGLGFRAVSVGKETPFTRPPWAREITLIESHGRRVRSVSSGEWWMEHPNDIDDLFHAEEARDELIKIAFSYFDFIKNKSKKMDQAKTFVLSHIPYMDAKRESRRLVGDHILTQNDCEKGDLFPDRISYGGWPMDVHHPEGIFSGEGGSFWCNGRVPIHTIPYRCLYSKNIDNLLFAGRCASVTHIALGTIRVESTLATLGQAAGTAAALCVRLGVNPRGIYANKDYLKKLQQTLLKNDQTIPGIVNEDPDDLARGAKVTASSTAEFVEFRKISVKRGKRHPMSSQRGMIVPWPGGRIDTLNLLLRSTADEPRAMKLHIGCADSPEALDGAQDTATAEIELPPKFENWAKFEIGLDLPGPFVWFWLERAELVEWALMTSAPPKSTRFYGATGSWQKVDGQYYAFHTEPPLVVPAEFKPEFAVSGPARKWDGKTNMWASNPRLEMPQWLEVDLGEPKTLNAVYLTFDTNMAPRLPSEANPPEAIRDYHVRVFTAAGKWNTVAEVTGNFLRRRIHRFESVQASRIRIEVLATNGFPDARIFEIRAYNE